MVEKKVSAAFQNKKEIRVGEEEVYKIVHILLLEKEIQPLHIPLMCHLQAVMVIYQFLTVEQEENSISKDKLSPN